MFKAALFKIAKIWKQFKCPSTVEWINWYIYMMEYRTARRNNEPLPCFTTGINLTEVTLLGGRQTQNRTYRMILATGSSKTQN